MRITISIFLLTIIVFSSCQQKKGRFYATPISGWTIDSTSKDGEQRLKMISPASGDTQPGIKSIVIMSELNPMSLNMYKQELEKGVKKEMFVHEKRAEGHTTPNGDEFTWARYAMRQTKDAVPVEQRIYYLKKDGNIYMIVCTTLMDGLENMEKEIDGVLKSFKVL